MKGLLFAIAVGASLFSANAHAAITIVNPAAANHIHTSNCPVGDGTNTLVPDPIVYLPPPAAGSTILGELAGGDTAFAGWTFNVGAALNGTLTIDTYKSRFQGNHWSGGEIDVRYNRAGTDPTNIRWVQMITTSNPLNGATSPYIDPFPNDDPAGAGLPFYYTQLEIPGHTGGANFDLSFYDFSTRTHPPTSSVIWRADLYLVSWDRLTPGTVTIHDGIRWGWNGACSAVGTPQQRRARWPQGAKAYTILEYKYTNHLQELEYDALGGIGPIEIPAGTGVVENIFKPPFAPNDLFMKYKWDNTTITTHHKIWIVQKGGSFSWRFHCSKKAPFDVNVCQNPQQEEEFCLLPDQNPLDCIGGEPCNNPYDPTGDEFLPGASDRGADPDAEPSLLISEIRIDQPGTDFDQYFELVGAPGTSLDGLTYLVIGDDSGDGSGDLGKRSGSIEAVVDLTGSVIPADGHFLAAEGTFTLGGDVDLVTSLIFENGDNVSHLLVRDFTGASGDDLDEDNDCVLDGGVPWAEIVDAISLVETENPSEENFNECNYGFGGGVGPDGPFVPGHVFRCEPLGVWTIGQFDPLIGQDTPGVQNLDCFSVCGLGNGDCCDLAGNGTPGCDDPECCALICGSDVFCCDFEWDAQCAADAANLCGPLCGCIEGEACDDGDACTEFDTCINNGVCVGQPVDCDDGDACTTDTCDSADGCQSIPLECPDGQVCDNGECVPENKCNPACVWDIDNSGDVRVPDLIKLLSCWGPLTGDPVCACLDIDNSGDIRVPDLIAMLAVWGPCP